MIILGPNTAFLIHRVIMPVAIALLDKYKKTGFLVSEGTT
jgi:hypothetical protein